MTHTMTKTPAALKDNACVVLYDKPQTDCTLQDISHMRGHSKSLKSSELII